MVDDDVADAAAELSLVGIVERRLQNESEAVALERFEARDRDPMLGKSRKDQDRALEKFDAWLSRRCGRSFDVPSARRLATSSLT